VSKSRTLACTITTAVALTCPPALAQTDAELSGHTDRHQLGLGKVRVRGELEPGLAGRSVRLERLTRAGWKLVDRTRTGAGGRFKAGFRASEPGAYRLRLRYPGATALAADADRLPKVWVYAPGAASWYGPGFYGSTTACGRTLTAGVKGVANPWLPCGTKVRLRYRGRSTTARVIDRGPFAGGRSWDLAPATKAALGFPNLGTVWAAY
jgi:rare lipoprotein A